MYLTTYSNFEDVTKTIISPENYRHENMPARSHQKIIAALKPSLDCYFSKSIRFTFPLLDSKTFKRNKNTI